MSSEFQKDLYNKKGQNFCIWDAFIALGIVSVGAGFYYRHQEKKGLSGNPNVESKTQKSLEGKEMKVQTLAQKNSESAIDKLGL